MSIKLTLETTNRCNLRCSICPNSGLKRPRGIMPWELFTHILSQLSGEGVEELALHGNGEPLLDPLLVGRVKEVRRVLPSTVIYLYTNGVLLNAHKAKELFEAGLNILFVSINFGDAETYTKVTGNSGFQALVDRTQRLMVDFPHFSIIVQCLLYHKWTNEEMVRSVAFMTENFGSRYICHPEHNYAGRNSYKELDSFWALNSGLGGGGCPRLRDNHIFVLWDGRVVLCCMDVEGENVIGDLRTQSFAEVRGSTIRAELVEGRKVSPLCEGCNST